MKVSQIFVGTLAAVFSLSAFAQMTVKTEAERERANLTARGNYPVIKFESTKSRAEVMAELKSAHAAAPMQVGKARPAPAAGAMQEKVSDPSLYNGA
ncbi:DUF4148 domain-containing protein [Herbaspirillum sp. YR522]|uniref:DUF4148 domain-containing protein n=1 Tax=Herbaspirillum sp. YR522 TaxID=1144342 RepID=UPI00026F5C0E|nr:DUF4148 domain-containing protein [Herbaspirillum sp. YR522]EJN10210.1 hypothetical protein PMI40_00172 [Herbaspirillum sp. YR522]